MRGIGPPLTAVESSALIRAARSCLGVRFRHQGRSQLTGMDCSGLMVWAMRDVGRPVLDKPVYGREPYQDGLRSTLEANLGPAVDSGPQPGDVVLMAFGGDPRHMGLIAEHPQGGLMLIHSYANIRKVTEHRLDKQWADRIVAVFRP